MNINSVQELNNFDLLILSYNDIDIELIEKRIQNKNYKVLVFFLDKFPKNIENLRKKFHQNVHFCLFNWTLFNNEFSKRWNSHERSVSNLEKAYKEIFKKNKILISFFTKLYASKDVILAFKKRVCLYLREYYEIIEVYNLLKKYNTNIIPLLNEKKYLFIKELINSPDLESYDSDFQNKIIFYKEKYFNLKLYIKALIFAAYPLFCLTHVKKIVLKKIKKKIAIRLYKKGIGFDQNRFRVDWIIDGTNYNKNNSTFVFEQSNPEQLKGLLKRNYDYHKCSSRNALERSSLIFILKVIFLYFPLGLLLTPIIFLSNKILLEEYLLAWTKFFAWKNFISIFNLQSYISYHHYSSDHIYRNILLSKIKCISVMYKHTHSENVFDYKNNYANEHNINSFYDIEFHWSKCSINMAKSNKTKSKKLLISGPIWSSKEFEKQNSFYVQNYLKEKHNIAFFPSSFNRLGVSNNIEAHAKFLYFIIEILNKYSDIKIMFKPKNDFEEYFSKTLTREPAKFLSDNKNFNILKKDQISTSIYSISDLIVSMSFTSTGVEAMKMGKKSFYVDLLNNFKNSYFDCFENLVSHSNESALKNFEFWKNLNSENVTKKYEKILNDMGINNKNEPTEIVRKEINKANKIQINV